MLYDKLISIKNLTIKRVAKFSNEEMGNEKIPDSLNGLIYSQVDKSCYETLSSIFNFCARLFIKILIEHKLTNGNKKVVMLFLILFLRNFGYHWDWSKGINQNYKYYESSIKQIVEKLEKVIMILV